MRLTPTRFRHAWSARANADAKRFPVRPKPASKPEVSAPPAPTKTSKKRTRVERCGCAASVSRRRSHRSDGGFPPAPLLHSMYTRW